MRGHVKVGSGKGDSERVRTTTIDLILPSGRIEGATTLAARGTNKIHVFF